MNMEPNRKYDVLIVGGGNAGLTAALSAAEVPGIKIAILEAAPREERGGNSRFAGASKVAKHPMLLFYDVLTTGHSF